MIPVVPYIDDFRNRVDARRFAVMGLSGDLQTIRNEWYTWERETAVGPWEKL